jgi:DNA-binding NtrC family response regulator
MPHTVLVVDPDDSSRDAKTQALSQAGYLVTSAQSFEAAYRRLQFVVPDLLITDLRLGANNGVHLVILGRVMARGMQAIVTDVRNDPGVAQDAVANGAVYIATPAVERELIPVADQLMAGQKARIATSLARRWARKSVSAPISGQICGREMTVLDLSYGGLRVEVADSAEHVPPGAGRVAIPSANVAVDTSTPIWARRFEASGFWWCGLELKDTSLPNNPAWRRFVDAV